MATSKSIEQLINDRWTEKVKHFPRIYDFHFRDIRDSVKTVLEIGVMGGESLLAWRDIFPNAQVVGVDISPACERFRSDRIAIRIGNQEDSVFMNSVVEEFKSFDIVIDDGGHTMSQQIGSFKQLFPVVSPGGWYVIEDIHTAYWSDYGGKAVGSGGTSVDMIKGFVDSLHHKQWNRRTGWDKNIARSASPLDVEPSYVDLWLASMHVYTSICFLEKRLSPNKKS